MEDRKAGNHKKIILSLLHFTWKFSSRMRNYQNMIHAHATSADRMDTDVDKEDMFPVF